MCLSPRCVYDLLFRVGEKIISRGRCNVVGLDPGTVSLTRGIESEQDGQGSCAKVGDVTQSLTESRFELRYYMATRCCPRRRSSLSAPCYI